MAGLSKYINSSRPRSSKALKAFIKHTTKKAPQRSVKIEI